LLVTITAAPILNELSLERRQIERDRATEQDVEILERNRPHVMQVESALQNVLTPEQFQQFLAGRDEMKQKAEQKLMEKRKPAGQ
jgi:hypothetical protein